MNSIIGAIFNKQLTNPNIYNVILGSLEFFASLEKLKSDLIRPIALNFFPDQPINDHTCLYILLMKSSEICTFCEHVVITESKHKPQHAQAT